jgi:hypothetical protein
MSTNISDLPTNQIQTIESQIPAQQQSLPLPQPQSLPPPQATQSQDKLQPSSLETNGNVGNTSAEPVSGIDQSTLSQLISGLQQASSSGLTSLASNHIPINDSIVKMATDPTTTHPNYVPKEKEHTDYIQNHNMSDLINAYTKKEESQSALDAFCTEFQIPALLAIMYFMFQLPIFKKMHFEYLPGLFSEDGAYNLKGLCFTSILFGGLYHIIATIIAQFTTF